MVESIRTSDLSKDLAVVGLVSVIILFVLIAFKLFPGLPVCPSFNNDEIFAAAEKYMDLKYTDYDLFFRGYSPDQIGKGVSTIPRRNCVSGIATYYLSANVTNDTIVLEINGTNVGFQIAEIAEHPSGV